jgi:L-ribulose-5-phosphate 3-epimerase
MSGSDLSRRGFVGALAAGGAGAAAAESQQGRLKLAVFSKHLQWAKWDEMAAVAAECGFDGVDLSVRKAGHVDPERVAEDLPRAFEAVHKAGLEMPMITAGIVDTTSPHAESILKTASSLGIRNYRWGGFKYDDSKPIPDQLAALRPRVQALADMNRHFNITAMYHTHSGMEVGAPIWDLWVILRDIDPKYAGINYDIGHATIEGGFGGWIRSAQLAAPYMRGVALKDYRWSRNARGEWAVQWCPPGEGMVQFPRFLSMLKKAQFSGPVQVHYEYAGLGGAEHGNARLDTPKAEVVAKLKRDVDFYRVRLREAGLA